MRKRKTKNVFNRGIYSESKSIIPTCRIEVGSDFVTLLSAATQTKPEKTVSDLYFYFLGEYKKKEPDSILFKKTSTDEEKRKSHHNSFTFLYHVFGFKIKITAAFYVGGREIFRHTKSDTINDLVIIFSPGDANGRSKSYRKVFDIKYLEDKMFSEQLFG